MNAEQLLRARACIGERTPLKSDCGLLCAGACCHPDEDGQGGVYLFPGEAALMKNAAWAHLSPVQYPLAPLLICDEMCDREARPLACRIFPLTPVRGKSGAWTVRMDVRARAMCPLTRSGIHGLDPEFVRAVRDAVRVIAEDAEGEAFLERWCALEDEYRKTLW